MDDNQTLLKVGINGASVATVWLLLFSLLLVGCETTKGPAPVAERAAVPAAVPERTVSAFPSEQTGPFYIVQRGDTLYGIALKHGFSQKDLAEWNNINDPNSIKPGQRLNLSLPSGNAGPVLFAVPQQSMMPIIDPSSDLTNDAAGSAQYPVSQAPALQAVKTSPKALKLPYSEQNALIQHSINPALSVTDGGQTVPAGSGTRVENAPSPPAQSTSLAMHAPAAGWIWPTSGQLLSSFSANSKGLKISGQMGQAIVATAAGEVVYSGDGLRGYGNLVIIKHNDTLLSAYAHNSKLLVKEGETVTQGQKIAEMGSTDTDSPQLHFEIRRHGKPVDPMEFLPVNPG